MNLCFNGKSFISFISAVVSFLLSLAAKNTLFTKEPVISSLMDVSKHTKMMLK